MVIDYICSSLCCILYGSYDIGTWMSGAPGEFMFGANGMEGELLEYSAKRLFRVVTVQQPPFMEWNETLGSRNNQYSDL